MSWTVVLTAAAILISAACSPMAPPSPAAAPSLTTATSPTAPPIAFTSPVATTPVAAPTAIAATLASSAVAVPPVATPTVVVPSPTPLDLREVELAQALANPAPRRDVPDLARRFRVKPGTPTPLATPAMTPEAVGDVHDFWVADSQRKRYFKARARLLLRSDHVDFYVQEGVQVDESAAARSLGTFESTILPTMVRDFGGNHVSLDQLRLIILNVRLGGLVGYYSSTDEYPRWAAPFSNERPLIGMSLQSVQPGTRAYDSGLAHEFQHFVQWRLDRGEETWVNEGTAELAIRAVGLDPSSNDQAFLQRPDTQLNDWAEQVSETPPHYGAADLFFSYLADQYGGYSVIGDILARPERGIAGIDPVLRQRARPDQPSGFDGAFLDWTVANWATQPAVDDGRYGYKQLQQARVRDEPVLALPTLVAGSTHQYAARYYALPKDAAGAMLSVTWQPTVPLVGAPPRGGPIWWSNRGDSADSRLTRRLDLAKVSRATLRFSTWFDLERDFDYAYVAVSTDEGRSWSTLSERHTTDADPNGANFGAGFTGKSGGNPPQWVDEEIDLTSFAGRSILLRFEMVTDDAYNGAGFCLDGVRVDEIGWRDNPDDRDWQAEGFVRIRNQVPERLDVRLVSVAGRSVRVSPVQLTPDGSGALRLPADLATADRAAIVVAAHTPLTIERTDFVLRFER